MRIISLNVNQFAGNGDITDTSKLEELNTFSREIIAFIKGFFIGNKEGIVILQEIPYWNYKNKKTRVLFDKFCDEFSDKRYKIITPHSIRANIVTLAITNNESGWNETNEFEKKVKDFKNRFVEIKNDNGVQLLGVHMPINPENAQENTLFWEELIKYSHGKTSDRFMIVGDFNAHIGPCDYRKQFVNIISKGYTDVIREGTVTFFKGNTMVDHILISPQIAMGEGKSLPEIYSDHAIIVTSDFD